MSKTLTCAILLLLMSTTGVVTGQASGWKSGSADTRAFIENNGQYDGRNWRSDKPIEFAYHQNPFYVFFSKNSFTYRFDKIVKNPARKENPSLPKRTNISELVHVEWLGANPNTRIISKGKESHEYHFAVKKLGTNRDYDQINASLYKSIIYKNLYDHIDVEYVIYPDGGIKYNIILNPGANPADIQLKYSTRHTKVGGEGSSITLGDDGALRIETSLGDIVEHAPISFYEYNSGERVNSKYVFENNVLSFDLESYDPSKRVVIDPWLISPNFQTSSAVWEVENDAANNTYSIGGETPMELRKYNAAGALQWTYVTPWDTSTVWLGTLATDAAGNSYVTSGVTAEMHKVDVNGNFVWTTAPSGGLEFNSEWWSITFNCDETKLIVGGTWVQGIITFDFYAGIFEIDVASGAVLSDQTVDYTNIAGFGVFPVEVRSISSSKNAKYIFLTHDDVGAINHNLTQCPTNAPVFQVDNQDNLSYKCENYLPETQNGGGLKALVANDLYFYTHSGDQIRQWDLVNGNLLNTVSLPGGSSNTDIFGDITVHCSGLDVDDCGNVYAGATDRVVKYDANLNVITSAATTFSVYDVSVNSNGEVLACGAQQDNSATNRNGRIESIGLTACSQYALVCCDANFCQVGPLCVTDAPVFLNPATGGGTWSGTGVDAAGNFDPAVSGAGSFNITYTLPCGSETITIVVNPCTVMSVCVESNGDLTVSGGSGPYTWLEPSTTQDCSACFGFPFPPCSAPAGCAVSVLTWTPFATGVTITPGAGADSVAVVNSAGDTLFIFDITTLPPCSAPCDATIDPAGPFCQTDPSVTLTAADPGGNWTGTGITNGTTGTFDPATAGPGTHTITYTLGCGDTDTENITVIATDDPSFSYASATYCTTDADPTPTITGTMGGTFTIDNSGTIDLNSGLIDLSASGPGTYTVSYNTGGTCPAVGTFIITITSGVDATISAAGPFCENDPIDTLVAVDGGGNWSGTGITNGSVGIFDPSTAGPGTHTITYIISGTCSDTDTETITVNAADNATISYTSGSYCTTDPDPTATIVGTMGGTFTIDNGGTIDSNSGQVDIASSGAGSYTITYITGGVCPDTATFALVITTGADATISPAGPYCANGAVDTLSAVDLGGNWSGTGITNGTTGTFDPSVAGPGAWTITYVISGSCGDTDTETITVNPVDDPTFNYPNASYCTTDPNPTPTIGGTGGGSFYIDNGGSINLSSGEIDIALSGTGTFNVTYVTNGICPDSSTVTVVITSGADATISAAGPYCANGVVDTLSAVDPGGNWSGTGITNGSAGTFDPSAAGPGTWTITYTISGSCGDTDTESITVTAADDPSFTYPSTTYCISDPNPVPTISGLSGGSFSIDNGGILIGSLGEVDIAGSGIGTYNITYVTNGPCPDSATFTIIINSAFDATITPVTALCEGDPALNLTAADPGGLWSGTGITSATAGTFDPSVSGAGTFVITYTIAGSCGDTDTEVITVNPSADASITASGPYCVGESAVTLAAADPGGTWTGMGITNGANGTFDPATAGIGSFDIIYTIPGTCGDADTVTIVVTGNSDASITPAGPYCESGIPLNLSAATAGGTWSGSGIVDATNGTFSPPSAGVGTWEVIYTISGACGAADTINIVVEPDPIAGTGPDVTIYLGESTVLNATGGGGYSWTPPTGLSCTSCPSPVATPDVTTTYCVTVTSTAGCTDTSCVTVYVEDDFEVFVPNIFSPNGDGNNDVFYVRGYLPGFQLFIFNRWGELIYETQNQQLGWDGTQNGLPVNAGVFVYMYQYDNTQGETETVSGNITVVR